MMNMNFNNKFLQRLFQPVDDVVWDMMSGKLGYSTEDGIVAIDLGTLSEDGKEAPDAQVTVNMFDDFGFGIPAFAQSVPVETVGLGDMIYSSQSKKLIGWVVKKNDKSFKVMKRDGTRSDWVPPKVQMLGIESGVMVLRSLTSMLPGGSTQLSGINSMMLPLMMMGGDNENMKSMLPMLLFSQMQGSGDANAMNPMLMAMMMGGGSFGNFGNAGKNFFNKRG